MPVEQVEFKNSAGHTLRGVLKYPDRVEDKSFPLVVVLHTFGSNSDHELITNTANFIYPYGYATLRFDFHGHGQSEGEIQAATITQKVDDVISAISHAEKYEKVLPGNTTLIGHGMGADVAILTAARDKRVKCLIVMAARSDLESHKRMFSKTDMEDFKTKGYCTHHRLGRINKIFLKHLDQHDIKEEIKKTKSPILILNGRNDFQVRWENARELYFEAEEPKRMEIIDDADHWFRKPEHRKQVMDMTIKWINRHIRYNLTYDSETTERMNRARLV